MVIAVGLNKVVTHCDTFGPEISSKTVNRIRQGSAVANYYFYMGNRFKVNVAERNFLVVFDFCVIMFVKC